MKTTIVSLALAIGMLASSASILPAVAIDRDSPVAACRDGTAPEGWLRTGGFCDITKAYHVTPNGGGNGYVAKCPKGTVFDPVTAECDVAI